MRSKQKNTLPSIKPESRQKSLGPDTYISPKDLELKRRGHPCISDDTTGNQSEPRKPVVRRTLDE